VGPHALSVLAWADGGGHLQWLWDEVPRGIFAPFLHFLEKHRVATLVLFAVGLWSAHVLKARAFVKVQKE
jgi:hypothetical protein